METEQNVYKEKIKVQQRCDMTHVTFSFWKNVFGAVSLYRVSKALEI